MEAAQPTRPGGRSSQTSRSADLLSAPSISLVLPAFNEQEVIEQAIDEADRALAQCTDDYEILVVDDGSSDQTKQVARQQADRCPHVRVIVHEQNRGYGAALRTGFQAAAKQWIGFSDADCQFDLTEIKRLVMLMHDNDIACGYRIDRQDHWLRLLYSRVYNLIVGILLGTRVRDVDCALKLFRREAMDSLLGDTNGFLVNAEMLTKARMQGFRVVEVGVTHRARPRGQSTVSVWHTIPVVQAMVRFWWSTVLFPAREADEPRSLDAGGNSTGEDRPWSKRTRVWALGSLCVLALVIFFGRLNYPLVEPDESRYAEIALEMVQSGDYVVPRLAGEPYLDKPPLLYWITAAGYRIFGTNEFAARVPAAFGALLTVLCTFLLGRRLLGDRAAYLAALMLFLCLGFVLSGRFLIMDGLLTSFTTLSILAAFLAVRTGTLHRRWWALAGLTCGLGVLTKGPIAGVLTVPPLLTSLWLVPRYARPRVRDWFGYALAVGIVTIPWFVLISLRQADFLEYFFWKHHVMRFVHTFIHEEPFWYYVPVLMVGMFPVSLLLAPVVAFLFSRREQERSLRCAELGYLLLAAVWIVGFFSLSTCKLPTYVLPAVPLFCLVQASLVSRLIDTRSSPVALERLAQQLPFHATQLTIATGAVLAVIDLVLLPQSLVEWTVLGLVLLSALAWCVYRVIRRGHWAVRPANWAVAASVAMIMMTFAFHKFVPDLAEYRSICANAADLQELDGQEPLPVAFFARPDHAASLRLKPAEVRRFSVDQLPELQRFLIAHPRVVVVADPAHATLLSQKLGRQVALEPTRRGRGRLFISSSRTAQLAPPSTTRR